MGRPPLTQLLTHTMVPRGRQELRPSGAYDCPALISDRLSIPIDTKRRSSFQNLLDRLDLTRVDWAAFKACLEDRLPENTAVYDEAIDKCVT